MARSWNISFKDGTLVLRGATLEELPVSGFRWDHRVEALRGPADSYSAIIYHALSTAQSANPIVVNDGAKKWNKLDNLIPDSRVERAPRKYQEEAVQAWLENLRRGLIVLPTGSGKSYVAELCILATCRPTLIVAPTLDLVGQWAERLHMALGLEIGIIGGGFHQIQDITVTTYDSMYRHLPTYGDRFCLLIFDEAHHLPAPGYLAATKGSLAPYRLGLTATPQREDGREQLLDAAVGPVVYRREIHQMSGEFLADYEVVRVLVELTDEERQEYEENRARYLQFLRDKGINMSGGWRNFIRLAARSKEGRAAFVAHQRAKKIAHHAEEKKSVLAALLHQERHRKILIFTNDNAMAYDLSCSFLLPCITHQTDIKERRYLIQAFASGELPVLVTSRVLNEGVDIPSAEIAVVLAGTGTVREHVQRLGRILRPQPGKQAVLFEVVSANTTEEATSYRRRRHDAYR